MEKSSYGFFKGLAAHGVLLLYSALALFPVLLIILNSFKDRLSIFAAPFDLPGASSFTLDGYKTLGETARFPGACGRIDGAHFQFFVSQRIASR